MVSRSRRYDLVLAGEGLICARDPATGLPAWHVKHVPAIAGQEVRVDEVPATQRTWHLGFGYSEQSVPGCYDYATDMDGRWPGVFILGPLVTRITLQSTDGTPKVSTASVSSFFEISSELYCLAGRYAFHIKNDNTIDAIGNSPYGAGGADFGSGVVANRAERFDGNIVIGLNAGTNAYTFSGTAWTQASDDVDGLRWTRDWSDASLDYRLWRAWSTNNVANCQTGDSPLTAANWSATATVGDSGSAITDLVAVDANEVYVAKTDGLYRLDNTGRNANVLEQASFLVDATNGVGAIYDGGILYPHVMGLIEYDPHTNSVRSIHPGGKTGNKSAVRGVVTALASVPGWRYAALYNETDSYLMSGRYPDPGEALPPGWQGPMIWHPIAKLTGAKVDAMHFSGLATGFSPAQQPRLWLGFTVGSTYDIAYIRVPKSGNVLAEMEAGTLTFAASGSLYLSPEDWGEPGIGKELVGFELENESVSATNYVDVYVSIDGGGWQKIGRAQSAGRSQFFFPTAGNWHCSRARFRLDVVNGTSTTSIKIKPLVARAALRVVREQLITTTIYCDDTARTRFGGQIRTTGQALLEHLRGLQDGGPVRLQDWWTGKVREQQVLVHQVDETMVEQQGDYPAGFGAQITFSIVRQAPAAWLWDSGVLYESGRKWG